MEVKLENQSTPQITIDVRDGIKKSVKFEIEVTKPVLICVMPYYEKNSSSLVFPGNNHMLVVEHDKHKVRCGPKNCYKPCSQASSSSFSGSFFFANPFSNNQGQTSSGWPFSGASCSWSSPQDLSENIRIGRVEKSISLGNRTYVNNQLVEHDIPAQAEHTKQIEAMRKIVGNFQEFEETSKGKYTKKQGAAPSSNVHDISTQPSQGSSKKK